MNVELKHVIKVTYHMFQFVFKSHKNFSRRNANSRVNAMQRWALLCVPEEHMRRFKPVSGKGGHGGRGFLEISKII